MKNKKKKWFRKKWVYVLLTLIIILNIVMIYETHKPMPKGTDYEGPLHSVEHAEFLYDLTYENKQGKEQNDQQIFPAVYKAIEQAQEFIVIDMFLFNHYYDGNVTYPPLSGKLTEALLAKKKENPDMPIIFISDEVNTTYNGHRSEELDTLKKHGIDVIMTDLDKLRDPNWLYSSTWRTFFQWFGQSGTGWIRNPMAKEAPKVNVRSYLKLANIKANHRKVAATEKTAILTSANPHDASGFNSNIGFQVSGNITNDILSTEKAVGSFSGSSVPFPEPEKKASVSIKNGPIQAQLLTERKVKKHAVSDIHSTKKGDSIWIAMFYLAERDIIAELKAAAERGVQIKLILDPNKNAFGSKKIGMPNLPVASELHNLGKNKISIRWYKTQNEQFHSKLLYIRKDQKSIVNGGSSNYTRRNLDNYNLESNMRFIADNDTPFVQQVDRYFQTLWENDGGTYTVGYDYYQDTIPVIKYIGYALQKALRLETF
ncbi:phospholipase D family protein [Bacillus sp. 1P06AnD]